MFVAVALHGILLGSDTSSALMQAIYAVAGGSVLLLTAFRMMTAKAGRARSLAQRVTRRAASAG